MIPQKGSLPHDETELIPVKLAHAQQFFDLIEENRGHLRQYNDPTAEHFRSFRSVLDSIIEPPLGWRQYGMWWGDILVGMITLITRQQDPLSIELGYWVAQKYCGIGIATTAVRKLRHLAFSELQATELFARVEPFNTESVGVLLNNGFRLDPERGTDTLECYVTTRHQYYGGLKE